MIDDRSILIVDDEEEMCSTLSEIFTSRGYNSFFTTTADKTEGLINRYKIDLVLMDVRMPDVGGLDLLRTVRDSNPDIPVIMISGFASIDNVIKCMKYGALNFYKKPIDIPALIAEVDDYLNQKSKKKLKNASLSCPEYSFDTDNPVMEKVYKMVHTAAPTSAPVVITGDSGTGKERIAMMIHELSQRKSAPFLKINCAAIPDNLLESELFGYEPGAFTDARSRKQGKFELAQGGSIFFDEIGDMSLATQAKLLRVLQEQEFERLGGTDTIKTDVRIIAATNKNFEELMKTGRFRDDLFYRISVINIRLPSLDERKEDLEILYTCFINHYSAYYGKEIRGLSPEVERIFFSHSWPGNIRELKNAVERAVIFCQSDWIEVGDLGAQYQKLANPEITASSDPESIYEFLNKKAIEDALKKAGGSKHKAAEYLNIHRKTLYNRMKKYGIEDH